MAGGPARTAVALSGISPPRVFCPPLHEKTGRSEGADKSNEGELSSHSPFSQTSGFFSDVWHVVLWCIFLLPEVPWPFDYWQLPFLSATGLRGKLTSLEAFTAAIIVWTRSAWMMCSLAFASVSTRPIVHGQFRQTLCARPMKAM